MFCTPKSIDMKPYVIKLWLLAFVTMSICSCSVDSELEDLVDEIETERAIENFEEAEQ